MSKHVVASVDELSPGDRMVVQLEGRDIAVFNVDDEYYAYTSWCAHQGGPCGEGSITGTLIGSYDSERQRAELEWCKEGEILNCPWHGWEYDITTGECLARNNVRLPSHTVTVNEGDIVVEL